jgi:LEA14-like dessication related protein
MRFGIIVVLALALAGCGGKGKTVKYDYVDASISELKVGQVGVLEQTWDMTLRMQNPNNYDIPADGMRFLIRVNGKDFARGVSNQTVMIPRLGEALLQVQAISDLPAVMNQINDMTRLGYQGLEYKLSGTVFSGEWRYPFEYKGTIKPVP